MIKPFSGGFDMKSICRKCDGLEECIKELEDELTTFIDEVNRLTVIKKELEELNDTIRNDYNELLKELERYKAHIEEIDRLIKYNHDCNKIVDLIVDERNEFEEAKE